MYDLGEIVGRYVLTGIIAGCVLMLMVGLRTLIAATSRKNNVSMTEYFEIYEKALNADDSVKKHKAKSKVRNVIEWALIFVIWPYFYVRLACIYMKAETEAIAKAREQ